jgi:prolyl 4-hydroxylase
VRASCTKAWHWEAKTVFAEVWRKIVTQARKGLPSDAGHLSCFAMNVISDSVAQQLGGHAGVQRVPTAKAEIFQLKRFVPPELCADLIALTDAGRRPSTIADDNGDAYFRTSETCDLAADLPAVQAIETMITQLSGIDPAYGEPLQGQRYDVGQEFKAHTDYFAPDGRDFARFCSLSGQRTWTFMIYLNDVSAGGATRFKLLDKTFQPEIGKLLCWNNRLPDGGVNHATLHHGMKVRKGVKYVITKWYREREWRG